MDKSQSTQRRAYLLLGAVIVLWGANWPIMKVGLGYIPPLWFAAARILLGGGCLFFLLAVQGRLRLPGRGDLWVLLSVGVGQLAFGLALIHLALQFVDAGRSAILAYTTPLWVAPMAVALLGERLGAGKLAGLVLGLGGVGVLFNPTAFDFSNPQALIGNAMLLASAVVLAAVIVHIRRRRWALSPVQLMPWQMLLGGVLLAAAAAWLEDATEIRWSWELAAVLAYNGPVASAFCFWAYVTVMRSLPAINTSLGSLGVPVAGVLFSALTLGEPLSMTITVGLVLITAGVALVVLADLRRARAKPASACQGGAEGP